ncbi:hypothetical protein [Paenibacillus sp. NPDC058071]
METIGRYCIFYAWSDADTAILIDYGASYQCDTAAEEEDGD